MSHKNNSFSHRMGEGGRRPDEGKKHPKGIKSFSPVLPNIIGLRRVVITK
jgi:hypothetical protein